MHTLGDEQRFNIDQSKRDKLCFGGLRLTAASHDFYNT
jgi:hypothetical protein